MSEFNHLRTFLEAYRRGSLSKAAAALGMTQPAASSHVRSLEAALGRPLFKRGARGLVATPAADDLARSLAPHVDALAEAISSARARSSHLTGTVHLAGPAELIAIKVAPLLVRLAHEGVQFRVRTGNKEAIYAMLSADEVDLAFTASRPESAGLGWAEIARERLVAVAAPSLLAQLGADPDVRSLRNIPLAAYDEELPLVSSYWEQIVGEQLEIKATITIPDLRAVERVVRAGGMWSVLPDYLCDDGLRTGELSVVGQSELAPFNKLYLAWNKHALRHPRVSHVRDALLLQWARQA